MLFPTQPSKKYFLSAALFVAGFICAARADSVVTDPVGFTTTSCLANSDTLVATPFTRPPAFVGAIISATGSTLSVAGSPGFTTNQFVYVAGSRPNHYYASIGAANMANSEEGRIFPVIANDASSFTLETGGENLATIPLNAQVAIIPY